MTFDNIESNMANTECFEWIKNKYRIVDTKDLKGYEKYLDEDVVLKFGNLKEIIGKMKVLSFLKDYWKAIVGMNHNLINLYSFKNTVILETNVEFVSKDDIIESIPSVTIIERSQKGTVAVMKIFIDNGPLFI